MMKLRSHSARKPKVHPAIVTHAPQNSAIHFEYSQGADGFDELVPYVIPSYLPARSLTVLFGPSGSYKSFLALSISAHIAQGLEWNGIPLSPSPVLYLGGEGELGIARRIRALELELNGGAQISQLYSIKTAFSLLDCRDLEKLLDTIHSGIRHQLSLIVIDTFSCFSGDADENSAQDMKRFVNVCKRLIHETGATILVIHHTGVKDQKRARGSSVLNAASDVELLVKKGGLHTASVTLHNTKNKEDDEFDPVAFPLISHVITQDENGEDITSLCCLGIGSSPTAKSQPGTLNGKESELLEVVLQMKHSKTETTRGAVRDHLKAAGTDVRNFSHWVKGCIEKGVIEDHGGVLTPTY